MISSSLRNSNYPSASGRRNDSTIRTTFLATPHWRCYWREYDAEKTVAAFSAGLRQEVNLEEMAAQLQAVVQETMQPEQVSLWLKPQKGQS